MHWYGGPTTESSISIILNLKVNQESTYLEQDLLDKVLNYLQQLTTSKNILLHNNI